MKKIVFFKTLAMRAHDAGDVYVNNPKQGGM